MTSWITSSILLFLLSSSCLNTIQHTHAATPFFRRSCVTFDPSQAPFCADVINWTKVAVLPNVNMATIDNQAAQRVDSAVEGADSQQDSVDKCRSNPITKQFICASFFPKCESDDGMYYC
jgi:hypothetical protein